jgi:hypothetical protein
MGIYLQVIEVMKGTPSIQRLPFKREREYIVCVGSGANYLYSPLQVNL